MATDQMDTVIRHLRRAVLRQDGAGWTDGQLLASFIDQKDETAFEALVRRHGQMVFGVCRRVVGNHHDAEDAFQATFLVLARKASSVRPRERVANWLHGVALRTAMKAKATTAKRRDREKQVTEMPEPEATRQDQWRDLQPLLDQELNGLPENYRLPILLCELEGKTIKDAAQQLGWPQGSLAGRLARGRKLLAKRLASRGVVLSAGSVAAVVSQNVASAGVPTSLMSSTVKAATMIAAGQATVAGVVPAKVAALMEGVLKSMMLTKLKSMMVVSMLLGVFAFGGGLLTRPMAAQQVEAAKYEAQDKAPKAKKERDKQVSDHASGSSPVTPSYVVEPPDILLLQASGLPKNSQAIDGEYLVRPDGTISLAEYGSLAVAGRSLSQIRAALSDHIASNAGYSKVDVVVNVVGYNSRKYYVINKRKDGDQVHRFTDTGGETVVGAILRVDRLASVAAKGRVWLARPSGAVLEVDWRAITQMGKSDTNYYIRSGDRVYVE